MLISTEIVGWELHKAGYHRRVTYHPTKQFFSSVEMLKKWSFNRGRMSFLPSFTLSSSRAICIFGDAGISNKVNPIWPACTNMTNLNYVFFMELIKKNVVMNIYWWRLGNNCINIGNSDATTQHFN